MLSGQGRRFKRNSSKWMPVKWTFNVGQMPGWSFKLTFWFGLFVLTSLEYAISIQDHAYIVLGATMKLSWVSNSNAFKGGQGSPHGQGNLWNWSDIGPVLILHRSRCHIGPVLILHRSRCPKPNWWLEFIATFHRNWPLIYDVLCTYLVQKCHRSLSIFVHLYIINNRRPKNVLSLW